MYDDYRQGIAAVSGCEQYERLVFMASANGADHCWGTCDNVSGCAECDDTGCGQDPMTDTVTQRRAAGRHEDVAGLFASASL